MKAAIPLLVLGGFLGAGKTTLLNRLLAGGHGQRIAVLVNDFGDIAVDSRLVAAADGDTIALSNGCICCSIGSSLMEALLRLLARPDPPERLVIEASGIADPARIAAIGSGGDAFWLEAIVTVADAETLRQRAADPLVGDTILSQLAAADLVVLNKTDLVDPGELVAIRQWLGSRTRAPVVPAVQAGIPDDLVLGLRPAAPALAHASPADHTAAFASWTLAAPRPFDRAALAGMLDQMSGTVWRAKGFLTLAEEGPMLLQMVGRRWSLAPAPPGHGPQGIVLIGPQGLDGQRLLDALGSAQV